MLIRPSRQRGSHVALGEHPQPMSPGMSLNFRRSVSSAGTLEVHQIKGPSYCPVNPLILAGDEIR